MQRELFYTKLFFTVSIAFIVTMFFLSSIVHADLTTATSTYNLKVDTPIYTSNIGQNAGNRYVGFAFSSSSEWGIESYSFQICKTTGNTDTLYGYLYDFELGERIATSTSPVTVSSTCTSYSTSTVSFSSYAFKDNKWYGVILGRADGSYSGSYYWRVKNYGNGSYLNKYFADTAFGDYISVADFYKFAGLVSFYVSDNDTIFGCTTGEASSTIECDMASTTEAVYAVGYTNTLLLGIFLCIIFGFFGYRLVKGYL